MSRIFGRVWCRRRRIWPGISDTRRTNDRHGLSSPHKYLKINVEAYRCWCAAWTSNPVIGANPLDGGFDSHTLPPLTFKELETVIIFTISPNLPAQLTM